MMHTVAITGINRGIGEGLTRRFLDAGHKVIGMGRSAPSWIENYGDHARFIYCDFSKPETISTAAAAIEGPIEVLICNAASFGAGAFHLYQCEPIALQRVFAINAISPVLLSVALKPRLAQGNRKLIIMMSTGNASLSANTVGSMVGYRCSKSALNQAVRTLAAEWGPDGITTIALNPGWVRTDMGGQDAPLSVLEASEAIFRFAMETANPELNGRFLNTDASTLPW